MSEVIEQATSAPDLMLVAYRALSISEQEEAFDLINDARLQRLAGENSEFGQLLASLKTVADTLGEAPGIDDYKRIRRELAAEGQILEPISRILKHFNGSWHLAKEAEDKSWMRSKTEVEIEFAIAASAISVLLLERHARRDGKGNELPSASPDAAAGETAGLPIAA